MIRECIVFAKLGFVFPSKIVSRKIVIVHQALEHIATSKANALRLNHVKLIVTHVHRISVVIWTLEYVSRVENGFARIMTNALKADHVQGRSINV